MRLIDADELKIWEDDYKELKGDLSEADETFLAYYDSVHEIIDNAPTVDAEPVRHGKLEVLEDLEGRALCKCSSCGELFISYYWFCPDYCPKCGAKMDLKEG